MSCCHSNVKQKCVKTTSRSSELLLGKYSQKPFEKPIWTTATFYATKCQSNCRRGSMLACLKVFLSKFTIHANDRWTLNGAGAMGSSCPVVKKASLVSLLLLALLLRQRNALQLELQEFLTQPGVFCFQHGGSRLGKVIWVSTTSFSAPLSGCVSAPCTVLLELF